MKRTNRNRVTLRRCVPTLVTGGAGFIGSHTVDALLNQGCRVRVLDDLSSGNLANLPLSDPCFDLMIGSTLDAGVVRSAMEGMQWCIHLAAQVSVARSIEDPVESANRNILGFIHMLEAARKAGIRRIVYASSAAVYGNAQTLPLDEDENLVPGSPYGLEKLVDERYADLYRELHGMSILGLRYFNVYGPRQDPASPYSGVISRFVEKVQQGERPVVYGDGEQTRDFIHVRDVAQANLAALSSTFCGVCNVATADRVSLLQLVEVLSAVDSGRVMPRFEAERAGDIRHSCGRNDRLRRVLGFEPGHALHEGLMELVASTPEAPPVRRLASARP